MTAAETATRGHHRAIQSAAFEAEAAWYLTQANREQAALGPGWYPDLLRGMAAERAAMAGRLRATNGAAS